MFNKGQLAGLMKQAQAMQDNPKKAQDELADIEAEGEAGAGLVKVLMTCKHDVKRITIDPSLLELFALHNATRWQILTRSSCARLQRSRTRRARPPEAVAHVDLRVFRQQLLQEQLTWLRLKKTSSPRSRT